MQQIRIQVLFSEDTPKGRFQDALYFTEAEYKNVKQADVDKMKKERKDKWLEVIEKPAKKPTVEEKESILAMIEEEKTRIING